ncbi:unnamed protein product [Periconia digitata]|uniref:Uncharacterized protein n=1 Tax=Periconia digitata TaxID=1303443 RepID=A0A9W4XR93_9PLEO|nr:unnamed protein product [Periconia digitata]
MVAETEEAENIEHGPQGDQSHDELGSGDGHLVQELDSCPHTVDKRRYLSEDKRVDRACGSCGLIVVLAGMFPGDRSCGQRSRAEGGEGRGRRFGGRIRGTKGITRRWWWRRGQHGRHSRNMAERDGHSREVLWNHRLDHDVRDDLGLDGRCDELLVEGGREHRSNDSNFLPHVGERHRWQWIVKRSCLRRLLTNSLGKLMVDKRVSGSG